MTTAGSETSSAQALQIARLISFLLLTGELAAAITVFLVLRGGFVVSDFHGGGVGLFDFIACGVGAACIVLAPLIRKVIWASSEGRSPERVASTFVRGTIVYMGLLETACVFSLVVWLVTGREMPNAALAFLLFMIGLIGVPKSVG